jgi:hypothetical protein
MHSIYIKVMQLTKYHVLWSKSLIYWVTMDLVVLKFDISKAWKMSFSFISL